jgi:hypothetical protein
MVYRHPKPQIPPLRCGMTNKKEAKLYTNGHSALSRLTQRLREEYELDIYLPPPIWFSESWKSGVSAVQSGAGITKPSCHQRLTMVRSPA